jgi:hypothetical protein
VTLHHFTVAKHLPPYPTETLIFALFNRLQASDPNYNFRDICAAFPDEAYEWSQRSSSKDGIIEGDETE